MTPRKKDRLLGVAGYTLPSPSENIFCGRPCLQLLVCVCSEVYTFSCLNQGCSNTRTQCFGWTRSWQPGPCSVYSSLTFLQTSPQIVLPFFVVRFEKSARRHTTVQQLEGSPQPVRQLVHSQNRRRRRRRRRRRHCRWGLAFR